MNRGHKSPFLAVLAGAMVLTAAICWAQTQGQAQNPPQKKAVEQKQDPAEKYTEEEYDACMNAVNEKDPGKKQAALIAFMEKYPKSELRSYAVNGYTTLMFEYFKNGEFAKLEPAAEQWLKFEPNDLQTLAFVAESALKLNHDQKFLEYGAKVYAKKPTAWYAYSFYEVYKKSGDKAKQDEWAQKLLEYPEFNDNFEVRMHLVIRSAGAKDLPKAAEYAQLTLKSLALAKKPDSTPEAAWQKAVAYVQHTCYDIIGKNYFEQKKYTEAIQALQSAMNVENYSVKSEKYDDGPYYIGLSQRWLKDYENAQVSFAVAELLKGPLAATAKRNLEEIYKPIHNDTTVGIEKTYKKAQAVLDAMR